MQRVLLQQADGHPTVAFRPSATAKHSSMLPNGTIVSVVARQGEYLQVATADGASGLVKARNARLIVPKPAAKQAPATAKPAAAAATTVAPALAPQGGCCGSASAAAKAEAAAVTVQTTGVCTFTVNDKPYSIDLSRTTVSVDLSVHDWIAANVPNSGARRSCGVGRCGSCVSMLTYTNSSLGRTVSRSFNACLRPILSCNGMTITTGTGIGSTAKPNAVQKSLADFSGTQCGFCSVGMVMNLYSKLADSKTPLAKETLDTMIDSNYCRCTGYRPILDTYKSFAGKTGADIGAVTPALPATKGRVAGKVGTSATWQEVTSEAELQAALSKLAISGQTDYFLVGGHTSKGLWPDKTAAAYVDVGGVASLATCSIGGTGLVLGAGTTITDALTVLESAVKSRPATETIAFKQFLKHGKLSPGGNIRNMGTLGGNVMIAYEHQKTTPFPTEWPLLLESVGALVTFVNHGGQERTLPIGQLYAQDLTYCYLKYFTVPYSKAGDVLLTYRTAQRHIYSEAFVAGVLSANVAGGVIKSAVVVFNGIGPLPTRVPVVEQGMVGMSVSDEPKFQALCTALMKFVTPAGGAKTVAFRKSLCLSYLYKFFLALQPSLPASLKSGSEPWLEKSMSEGKQTFNQEKSVWPLNEAIPKVDGLKQTTGEAQYIQNIPLTANTLHAAPVVAKKVGKFTISDAGVSDKVVGYKGLVLAKDVPDNSTSLIADGASVYIGHVVAIALATTPAEAVSAAAAVTVTYTDVKEKLILTIDDAIAASPQSFYPHKKAYDFTMGDVAGELAKSQCVVKDTWQMGPQYHFYMETQSAYAFPETEGSVSVHSSTQMPPFVQGAVATVLKLQKSNVVLKNKRCGGGFGGKLMNSFAPAQLAAVSAHKAGVPVSIVYEQGDNMLSLGTRPGWRSDTTIGFDKTGRINVVKFQPYICSGMSADCGGNLGSYMGAFDNCYNVAAWDVAGTVVKTDLPTNTSMRAPGWLPAIFSMERVITTVAVHLGLEPAAVREVNFYQKNQVTPSGLKLKNWDIDQLWAKTKATSDYDARLAAVKQFNAANRWTKKGLTLVASKFAVGYGGTEAQNAALMDSYMRVNRDGSVSVMSGGTEMGQGLTTKVTQTVAYHLGLPMDAISILEQSTAVVGSKGSDVTGGSVGSELSCLAAKNGCTKINEALAPVRKLLPSGTWAQIIEKAYELGISLHFLTDDSGIVGPQDPSGQVYNTYGVVALEATLDVLTGQVDYTRADIVYDLGRSVNPIVDIGQIEGAFVMGLGLTMTEDIEYAADGVMKYADYVLPTPWEIPTQFNVTLAEEIANPMTAGGGKAIGEPPMTMTYAAVEAVEMAVAAAVKDAGGSVTAPTSRSQTTPFTVERRKACLAVQISDLRLK